ncbi:hypothetical protein EVAR_93242_1 [Eumeta japonica]|uniref:Uncharacterized protein n=1 Tax=Eumeta variegata TaxID=151549 RepID=A0A4C1TY77_EUMVA|nr:hypothetical protein EVAR_93242_1 [Eumeta japonica]
MGIVMVLEKERAEARRISRVAAEQVRTVLGSHSSLWLKRFASEGGAKGKSQGSTFPRVTIKIRKSGHKVGNVQKSLRVGRRAAAGGGRAGGPRFSFFRESRRRRGGLVI